MINELTRKNAHTELDHIFKTILPAHGMTERPEQIRLSHTMLDAMFENRIALSDAGTGIGKTYLGDSLSLHLFHFFCKAGGN